MLTFSQIIIIISSFQCMTHRLNQNLQRKLTPQKPDEDSKKGRNDNERIGRTNKIEQYNQEQSSYKGQRIDAGAQGPAYYNLIKFIAIIACLLCLAFTLPLCLIISSASNTSSSYILSSFSTFSLLSSSSLSILAYLVIPAFLIHLVILILLSFRLKKIQAHIVNSQKTPTSYSILMRIPPPQINEEQLCQEIQAWFRRQFKHNNKISQLFPELCPGVFQQQISDVDSSFLSQGEGNIKLKSRIVEAVLLSYNYEEFVKISQEVGVVDGYLKDEKTQQLKPAEINALVQLYNKKKNILALLPVNEYCILLFKDTRYAQYFYSKNKGNAFSKFFCVENYSDFEIEGQKVEMVRGILPNEVYWKNMHFKGFRLIKKSLGQLVLWMLFMTIGVSIQFLCIYFSINNPISALIINVMVVISNKLMIKFHNGQPYPYYSQKKKSIITQLLILDMIDLAFAPLIIRYLQSPVLISDSAQFITYQIYSIIFFMVFSIADIIITSLCFKRQKENNKHIKQTKHSQNIEIHLINNLCVFSLTYFIAPMFPLAIVVCFIWFLLIFLFQKVKDPREEGEYHGGKLINSTLKYLRRSFICFIIGTAVIYGFAAAQLNIAWSIEAIIIISLSTFFIFLLQIIDLQSFSCFQKNQIKIGFDIKGSLLNCNYQKVKDNFVMLYEQFNFALNETFKKTAQGCSARIKIYEQLNTMSKTLSLSLKERLFFNTNPIINNQKRAQAPQQDVNDIYFEYEKKVTMKKTTPKVAIPPLFKKEEPIHHEPQNNNGVEMMKFNSIFSSDHNQGKKMLKKHIKKKLQVNAVHK